MAALLGVEAAAGQLDVEPRTMDDWRLKRKGPAWIKVGRLVKYDQADLDAWVDANRQDPAGRRLKAVV